MSWDLPCLRSLDRDAFPKGQKQRQTNVTDVRHIEANLRMCRPKVSVWAQAAKVFFHWRGNFLHHIVLAAGNGSWMIFNSCHQGLDRRCHATGWPRGWKDPPKHRPAGWTIDSNQITEEPILHYLGKPPLPITNYHNHSVYIFNNHLIPRLLRTSHSPGSMLCDLQTICVNSSARRTQPVKSREAMDPWGGDLAHLGAEMRCLACHELLRKVPLKWFARYTHCVRHCVTIYIHF